MRLSIKVLARFCGVRARTRMFAPMKTRTYAPIEMTDGESWEKYASEINLRNDREQIDKF